MNLVQKAIAHGGKLAPLVISHGLTSGTGLMNPSIFIDGDGDILVNLRHVNYTLYHAENTQRFPSRYGPLSYLHPEKDRRLITTNYLCRVNKDLVMTEIRDLFPERTIPDPIFFKQHPGYDGCTYWLPGNYNVREESFKSLHPMPITFPNLYMCGESFALKQCWMESAIDQADNLLDHSSFRMALRNI